jgi:hypothetical protein
MKKIIEQTSSASSGSFETQMGSGMVRRNFHPFFDIDSEEVQPKKKKKQLNKKKKPMKKITISEIENIILKTLIHEEVYSEKPIESKGKDISSKNAKSKVTTKTSKKIDDITSKSGKESKSDVSGRTKKVSDSLKNNLKGAEVKDVNKFKKVDDDYETEAYQNGMEDIAYERISDEQKEKNTKYIKSSEMRKNPNAEKSGKAADKMIKQAKQRGEAKKRNPFNSTYSLGKDMEFLNNKDKQPTPRKKLGVNENTIKKLTFKSQFRDDKDMLKKIPSKYKQNDLVFEMYDGDSNYRVRWEGTENNGIGVIIEHKSASKEMKNMKMFESLNKFESLDFQPERNIQSSTLNENQIFKQMLNQSRRLINEADDEVGRVIYFEKLVDINTVQPASASAGIDTGIKNPKKDVQYKTPTGDNSNILVPAPTEAINNTNLADYNKVLSGDAPYDNTTFDFGVSFDGKKYSLGEATSNKEMNAPTFTSVGATEIGGGRGKMLTSDNATSDLLSKIQSAYGERSLTVPAPLEKTATGTETIEKYNTELISFVKKYYPKLGVDIEWKPKAGFENSFTTGMFQIKGGASTNIAQTGEEVYKLNYDNAYNYLKIGDKFYVQKKGKGDAKDPKQYIFIDPSKNKAAHDAIKSKVFA